ncbi:hypothetical protein [Salinimicrobium oceani]|uniref:Uncharacterized protein n=1 Tax=Salinimicrobium oceani TaxID=2722702 RepID=A0ABX1D280_9FLAO|nr:hypothetical protein [Salinimicrobium oceani]NJW54217.1 hypothetical protein [Salinimicrobium oceani]
MNKLFLLFFLMFCYSGSSQELPANPAETGIFKKFAFSLHESSFTGSTMMRPSLSFLTPDFPESTFTLTEVNFNKEQKREVNLIAIMKQERIARESGYIDLEAPVPTIGRGEKSLIEVTNDLRRYDRGSNYDIYTGEKKIPAYDEMKVPLFSRPHYSGARVRGYISPYSYSSFLR